MKNTRTPSSLENQRRFRLPLVAGAGLFTVLVVVLGLSLYGPSSLAEEFSWLGFGPEMAEVPAVLDEPREEAVATLRARGFDVRVEERESSAEDEGLVMRQLPSGSDLEVGETVEVWIGQGPPPGRGGSTDSSRRN